MNTTKKISLLVVFLSVLMFTQVISAYLPDNKLIATQVAFESETTVNFNIEVAIIIKNYLNISITDVQISLNLSSISALSFTSCEFGVLNDDNVTLNETMVTSNEFNFASVNVTYGYMTADYLTFNISKILNGTKILFRYNITSTEDGPYTIPGVKIVYYDNWGDKNEISSTQTLKVVFNPEKEQIESYLPDWSIATHKIDTSIMGLILYGIPILAAVIMSIIGSIRNFAKK